jgi:hypothetical protein
LLTYSMFSREGTVWYGGNRTVWWGGRRGWWCESACGLLMLWRKLATRAVVGGVDGVHGGGNVERAANV